MKKTKDETMSVPRRVRGVLEAKGQDHYEFTPFSQTGESSQVDVIGIGKDGTKTYLTTGQKPKRVAHLVVDAAVPDQKAALRSEIEKVFDKLPKNTGVQVVMPRGSIVLYKGAGKDLGECRMVLDEKKKELVLIQHLPLKQMGMESMMMTAFQRYSQQLMLNRAKFNELIAEKGGAA